MTSAIICTLCILLLVAYVFDLTSGKTRIPSVIPLLLTGWVVQQAVRYVDVPVPNLNPLLPVFGTVGLILIVLEGSLELELDRSKKGLIYKSFIVAAVPMLLLALGLAAALLFLSGVPFRTGLINAIPLCVISSAIAIPTVKSLTQEHKEFVVYESSISDILGVLFFNFVTLNESYGLGSVFEFSFQIVVVAVVSFAATIGLALLLRKIDHHVKFVPIIITVILIYAISKIYHLPALLFILLFGLAAGNLDELRSIPWINRLQPGKLNSEVHKLKHLTTEITFIIRALFFMLFGFLIDTKELLDGQTFAWAVAIVAGIFIFRAAVLKAVKYPLRPLLFIAPRGLITILLFLSILPDVNVTMFRRSLIIQVILLTVVVMMVGMMLTRIGRKEHETISDQSTA